METNNIKQISSLFKQNYKNTLYPTIHEYLNGLSKFKYILINKNKVISIYTLRSEINIMNDSPIEGYNDLLNNLSNYDGEKVIISNFIHKKNDITIFISDKKDKVIGILYQKNKI